MEKEKKQDHEHEYEKHALHLIINGKQFEWYQEYITGDEIRELAISPLMMKSFLP